MKQVSKVLDFRRLLIAAFCAAAIGSSAVACQADSDLRVAATESSMQEPFAQESSEPAKIEVLSDEAAKAVQQVYATDPTIPLEARTTFRQFAIIAAPSISWRLVPK